MIIKLAHAAHWDTPGVVAQPAYDTLIGICHPASGSLTGVPAQTAILHFYEKSGIEVPKSPQTITLEPLQSVATTLIKGNILSDPPQDFDGDMSIEFPGQIELPYAVWRGGNGPAPDNWNYATPSIQSFGSSQRTYGPATHRIFPYLIHFDDPAQHAGVHAYRTDLRIRNDEAFDLSVGIKYTVGQFYANAGQISTASVTVPAGQQFVGQLHEIMPGVATMNPRPDGSYEGSEGWLDITTTVEADLRCWLCWGNASYMYQGASELPWCY